MTKYSIGPLHFEFSWSFEWRTKRHDRKRHDRIHTVADAYCRLNPLRIQRRHEQSPVTWRSPIVESELFYGGSSDLKSCRELLAVIHELQRRGYGPSLHEDLIAPGELWEFFQWELENPLWSTTDSPTETSHKLAPFTEPPDFYFEVYRWRNPGKLDR